MGQPDVDLAATLGPIGVNDGDAVVRPAGAVGAGAVGAGAVAWGAAAAAAGAGDWLAGASAGDATGWPAGGHGAGDATGWPAGGHGAGHGGRRVRREQVRALAASARRAGRGAVLSGRWLAEVVVGTAPRVPVRDAATLSDHHDGLTGDALARALVRSAGRVSAGVAAATGGLVAAQELSVAGAVAVPFELAAETALVVLVELKLVAELHQVAGRPLLGGPVERSAAAITSWLSGHAFAPGTGRRAGPARGLLGRAGRRQLVTALRRRYRRNLATLGPLLTGAAAAGYLNRRATVAVGSRVARDLGLRP